MLPRADTPVNKKILAGRPSAGGKVEDCGLELLRVADTAKHGLLIELLDQIGERFFNLEEHVRSHRARRQRVDGDAIMGQFHGHGSQEAPQGSLRGSVTCNLLGIGTYVGGDGSNENNGAIRRDVRRLRFAQLLPLPHHGLRAGLGDKESTDELAQAALAFVVDYDSIDRVFSIARGFSHIHIEGAGKILVVSLQERLLGDNACGINAARCGKGKSVAVENSMCLGQED